MRATWLAMVGLGLLVGRVSAGEPLPVETRAQRRSYAMGVSVARDAQRRGVDVDVDVLARGVRDAVTGRELAMSEEELRSAMGELASAARRRAAARRAERQAAARSYLAENAARVGVVTLASGVQVERLDEGAGERPGEGDTVVYHFRGAHIDGEVFDSTYRRGRPARLGLARAPPAWREVLSRMAVGSTWRVVLPPGLGGSPRGRARGGRAPRDEALVFELTLLSIERRRIPARAPAPGAPGRR